jgi:hypothetical protein
VPDWAAAAMDASVYQTVLNTIVEENLPIAAKGVAKSLAGRDPDGQRLFLDDDELQTYYYEKCIGPVRDSLKNAAAEHARLITDEWMNRPWPYEISPPVMQPSAKLGLTYQDRARYFTVAAAAREAEGTRPRDIMEWVFHPQSTKLVTTSQAEAFNWMEFNDGYGGQERYDQVTLVPRTRVITYRPPPFMLQTHLSPSPAEAHLAALEADEEQPFAHYTPMRGAPRSWRDASIGGWNWRSRVSLGDAIYPAMQDNVGQSPDLREYFHSAGMSTSEPASFYELQLH